MLALNFAINWPISYISSITNLCSSSIPKNLYVALWTIRTFNPPLKKCWNFKVVFQRNSASIPEVNIWNHSGILMEFHWNTIGILPPILSKFTACFPELFWWNTTHFLAEKTGILMELLWYFDEILVVFWWNTSQKKQ